MACFQKEPQNDTLLHRFSFSFVAHNLQKYCWAYWFPSQSITGLYFDLYFLTVLEGQVEWGPGQPELMSGPAHGRGLEQDNL